MIPSVILTKTGNKTYPLQIALEGDNVLIRNTKHKHKNSYSKSYITVPDGKICVWYSWKTGKNQKCSSNNGVRINYIVLPRYIHFNKLTLNALGLLQAEMGMSNPRSSYVNFTNSNSLLVRKVLNFFSKEFEIPISDWSWSITFNYKLKQRENDYGTILREETSLNFWEYNIPLNRKNRRTKWVQYTGNKTNSNMSLQTKYNGSLVIGYSNILLYQLLLNLLSKIISKELNLSSQQRVYFLQGVIAGDGCVKLSPYSSLQSISIGCTNTKESYFYKYSLDLLDVSSTVEKTGTVRVCNLKNMLHINNLGLVELHLDKLNKFNKAFLEYKQIPDDLKVRYYILKKEVNLHVY